ncbi:unnamed protein product, partial [Brassica rapa subsp. trilocularis]
QGERSDVFSRVQLPVGGVSRQSLLRDKATENRFGRDGYGRRDNRSRSPVRERRTAGGFMNDARAAYSRRDGDYSRYDGGRDKTVWGQGGKERKSTSGYAKQSSRYAPYGKHKPTTWRVKEWSTSCAVDNEEGTASYVGTQSRSNGDVSVQIPDDVMVHDPHKSGGKRIASQIVTPVRNDNDDNVTKRPRISPRLLTFSPTEKVLPDDAQIIGALNGMEIAPEIQDETMIAMETQDDDLLGEDLMEMEGTGREVEPVGNGSERVKPRKSSHKSGGRSGFPFGIQNKKAVFLRRGSPRPRRSSSRDKLHTERQGPGP